MAGGEPNNRVTTAQFYEAQLKTNKAISDLKDSQNDNMAELERRIMEELKGIPVKVETNTKEIDRLRKRSDIVDAVEGLGMLVVSIFLGTKQ
jgi:hypothetical protein